MAASHKQKIELAAKVIAEGGIIAYPTESVWGLGCDPLNHTAVTRLLQLKSRVESKGLILIASSIEQVQPYLEGINKPHFETLHASWPGPSTWLVPDNHVAPQWITGGQATLALRVSAHPVVQALCDAVGGPIVSTSANPQGLEPAKTDAKVSEYFQGKIDVILSGSVGESSNPTSIRNLVTGELVRPS